MKKRTLQAVWDALWVRRALLILWAVTMALNASAFLLYDLPIEAFFYSATLSAVFVLGYYVIAAVRNVAKARARERLIAGILSEWKTLPEGEMLAERDYCEMLRKMGRETERVLESCAAEKTDLSDYYTAWVHQIKTPIAVMRMLLGEPTEENRALLSELFRIEGYVEMVLQYIRLESEENDLVIRSHSLDELIRKSLRKFASQFIARKLKLDYLPTEETVVTDEKWFAVIFEQILSNAIKYTREGSVTIRVENGQLSVSDTGIGIAAEDLPRIFQKGYTGKNGRIEQKSSGLGLYLCSRAAKKLSVPIRVESTPGVGSRFVLDFRQHN